GGTARRGQQLAALAERQRLGAPCGRQGDGFLAPGAAPGADVAVVPGAGQAAAVAGEGQRVHALGVGAQPQRLTGEGAVRPRLEPQADYAVIAAGRQVALRTDRDALDHVVQPGEGVPRLAGSGVPDEDLTALVAQAAAGNQQFAVGAKGQALDRPQR